MNEFKAYFDKKQAVKLLLVFPLVIIFWICVFFNVRSSFFLERIVFYLIGLVVVLFLVGYAYLVYLMIDNRLFLILNEKGLWIRFYGFIPWSYVELVDHYTIRGVSQEAARLDSAKLVGVRIKPESLSSIVEQASMMAKCGLAMARFFGYKYHIYLGMLTIPSNDIVQISSYYLKR